MSNYVNLEKLVQIKNISTNIDKMEKQLQNLEETLKKPNI
jgi:uncharacterized membrane protein YjjP (DUF1212 family)